LIVTLGVRVDGAKLPEVGEDLVVERDAALFVVLGRKGRRLPR